MKSVGNPILKLKYVLNTQSIEQSHTTIDLGTVNQLNFAALKFRGLPISLYFALLISRFGT